VNQDHPPMLTGMATAGRRQADEVGNELSVWVGSLDAVGLQRALGDAARAEARLRAEYADAVDARTKAEARGDRQAETAARAEVRARSDAVRVAAARTQALRSAVRARRDDDAVRRVQDDEIPERFCDVEDFVAHFMSVVIERRLGGGRLWCAKWWKHPEAVNRLWALWRAYEAFRAQGGTALSAWWIYHVDSHLSVVMGESGPFWRCRKGHQDGLTPLPNLPAPEGWWQVVSIEADLPVDVDDVGAVGQSNGGGW